MIVATATPRYGTIGGVRTRLQSHPKQDNCCSAGSPTLRVCAAAQLLCPPVRPCVCSVHGWAAIYGSLATENALRMKLKKPTSGIYFALAYKPAFASRYSILGNGSGLDISSSTCNHS